jgi:hypothetical protein
MQISEDNYRELLISLLEQELSPEETAEVESYIQLSPKAREEWKRLQLTRFHPDMSIRMPGKERLYRHSLTPALSQEERESDSKVRKLSVLYSKRVLAVAAVIAAFLIGFFIFRDSQQQQSLISSVKVKKKEIAAQRNVPEENTPKAFEEKAQKDEYALPKTAGMENLKKPGAAIVALKTQSKKKLTPAEMVSRQRTLEPVEAGLILASSSEKPESAPIKLTQRMAFKNPEKVNSSSPVSDKRGFLAFLSKVKINRIRQGEETYYAVSLKTQDVNINKTIKLDF